MHLQQRWRWLAIVAIVGAMVAATASHVAGQSPQPLTVAVCPGGIGPSRDAPGGDGSRLVLVSPGARSWSMVPTTDRHQSVVRVVNAQMGSRSFGSGTLLDKTERYGIVLTCAHLFREGVGAVSVVFSGGHAYGARVLKIDRAWDLAALLIYAPAARALPLAADPPAPGDVLSSCGYGGDGRLWCNQGRALEYVIASGTATAETLEISGMARQGDSGGPILNARAELAGIVLATNGRMVVGTCCKRIRKFLAGLSPRFSRRKRPPQTAKGAKPQKIVPDRLPVLVDQLDQVRQGIHALQANLKEMQKRFETRDSSLDSKVERLSILAGALTDRVSKAESGLATAVTPDKLAAAIGPLLPVAKLALPAWLMPLAASGPVGLAAVGLGMIGRGIWRRRERDRRSRRPDGKDGAGRRPAHARESPPASTGLNDDYGRQLLGVFAQSGRSPVQDATLGREYDEEIRNAEQSSDPALARWARRLREKVERKFHRIHGLSPAPVEPVAEAGGSAAPDEILNEGENS